MFQNKNIYGLIPARGGSKGVKNKNIYSVNGKPLISYTIQEAKSSKYLDRVIVTTDSKEIADISLSYGAEVPFMRPSQIAQDTSKTIDAVIHAIGALKGQSEKIDVLVLLQPTQPLRLAEDIDNAIEIFFENNRVPLASVSPVEDHPILIRSIKNNILEPIMQCNSTCRRQDMPTYYKINGCIYINNVDEIDYNTSFNDNLIPYIMLRSHSVDIDNLEDIAIAEYYLNQNQKQ